MKNWKNNQTEDNCLEAVTQDGLQLKQVVNQTFKICLKAVRQNGKALRYVNEEFKTEKMCLEAVTQNGSAFKYVPEQLKTENMCLTAIEEPNEPTLRHLIDRYKPNINSSPYKMNANLPLQHEVTKLCLKLSDTKNESPLKHMKNQTEELCKIAIKRNACSLKFVKKITVDICECFYNELQFLNFFYKRRILRDHMYGGSQGGGIYDDYHWFLYEEYVRCCKMFFNEKNDIILVSKKDLKKCIDVYEKMLEVLTVKEARSWLRSRHLIGIE